MKGSKFLAAAGWLVITGLPVLAQATNVPPVPTKTPSHHPVHRREILQALQLTDDQRQQIQDCRAAYRKKMAELNGQLQVKQVELENEMDQTEPDQDKLAELTQSIGDLLGQRLLERAQAKITIEKQILTPQQADQLKMLQLDSTADSDDNI